MTYEEIRRDKCKTYLTLIKVGASYSQLAKVDSIWTDALKHYLNPASPQGSLHPKRLPFFDFMLSFVPEYWKLYDMLSKPKSYLSRQWGFDTEPISGNGHIFFANISDDVSVYDLRKDDVPKSLSRMSSIFKKIPKDSFVLYIDNKVILWYNKKEWKSRRLYTTLLERIVETKSVFGDSKCIIWHTVDNTDEAGCYFYSDNMWIGDIKQKGMK